MTRHKIVLVPFPFDDLSGTKVRPALCLTDPIGIQRHVIIAFITSRIPPDPVGTDLTIPADHPDFPSTGLRITSTIRLHRVMTISTRMIRRELGTLSPGLRSVAHSKLMELFAPAG